MVKILEGVRVVEGAAFVAAPLAGMTLAQMGADVIRFDRIRGGLDYSRWPVTPNGRSLFWAGLNKGKRSIAVDMSTPHGQEIVTRLIVGDGTGDDGIYLTNLRVRGWMSYEELSKKRKDLIMMMILGDRQGGPQVDYTINPAVGFPAATGPEGSQEPVGHVLPAWDCITGQQAALGILAAKRHRRRHGEGQLVELALKDMALSILGNLGIIGEMTVNGEEREKIGNSLYGAYAQDFICKCGERIMVIGLTERQWKNLKKATGTMDVFNDLAAELGADLSLEGERYLHRHAITEKLKPFFDSVTVKDIAKKFDSLGVTWSVYRTFKQAVEQDPDISTENPMFTRLHHPGIGTYLTPGNPISFSNAERVEPRRAPALGENTEEILHEIGYSGGEIAKFYDDKVVASAG
jgi:2-methylfumaryl-CoA isomerase